jgi:hypothetical protein
VPRWGWQGEGTGGGWQRGGFPQVREMERLASSRKNSPFRSAVVAE